MEMTSFALREATKLLSTERYTRENSIFLHYQIKGYRMVPSNLKVLAKFGLCSDCSKKLGECSLARARKIFAPAYMLGYSLKIPAV